MFVDDVGAKCRSCCVPNAQPEPSSVFTNVYAKCCACWGPNARLTMCTPNVVHVVLFWPMCTPRPISKFCALAKAQKVLPSRLRSTLLSKPLWHTPIYLVRLSHFQRNQMLCMLCRLGAKCSLTMWVPNVAHVVCQMHNQNQVLFLPMCTPNVVHAGGQMPV